MTTRISKNQYAWLSYRLRLLAVMLIAHAVHAAAAEPPRMLIAGGPAGALIVENGKVVAHYPTRKMCQDAWQLNDGSILATESIGVTRFSKDGRVLMRYTASNKKQEIHSCMPLPDGHTLIGEAGPARLLELDPSGKVVKTLPVPDITFNNPHLHMRGMRVSKDGEVGIISSGEMRLIILNADGSTKTIIDLKTLPASITQKLSHAFTFLDNGNYLISTSYGSCFVELNPDGEVVWSLTPKDVPELGLTYAAGMQRLKNGNTVCTANKSPFPIFEVTPDKKVVWKIAAHKDLGQPLHVQVLDTRQEK